jgi:hypothetical protein
MPVIPALTWEAKAEDCKFEANLGYISGPLRQVAEHLINKHKALSSKASLRKYRICLDFENYEKQNSGMRF